MTWDERGRLWVAEHGRLPQRPAARRPGPRPHHDLRGHRRRRQGRQVHRLRRQAEHPDEPASSPTAASIVHQAPRHAVPQGHRRRRQGRRAQGAVHRLGHRRHARRAEQPALRPRQLDLRHRRLLRLQRHGRRRAAPLPPGLLPLQAATAPKLEFLRTTNNNTWGLGFSEEGLLFGSTANGSPSVYLPIPNRYYETVRGWSPTRAAEHRRRATASTRSPTRSGRSTGTAASPPRPATPSTPPAPTRSEYWNRTAFVSRADRPPRRRRSRCSRDGDRLPARTTAGTCWPATTSGPRPITAEVGPDGNVWVIDWYNLHRPAQPDAARLQDRQGRPPTRPPLRDKTHGRIYRLVARTAPSRRAAHDARRTRRPRSWSRR